jgi:hypothetical protein
MLISSTSFSADDLKKNDHAGLAVLRRYSDRQTIFQKLKRLKSVRADIVDRATTLERAKREQIRFLTIGIGAMRFSLDSDRREICDWLAQQWNAWRAAFKSALRRSGSIGHRAKTTRWVVVPEIDIVPCADFEHDGRKVKLIKEMNPSVSGLGSNEFVIFFHAHAIVDFAGHVSRKDGHAGQAETICVRPALQALRADFPGPYRVLAKPLYKSQSQEEALRIVGRYMGKALSSRALATSEWQTDPSADAPTSHRFRKLEGDLLTLVASLQCALVENANYVMTNLITRKKAGEDDDHTASKEPSDKITEEETVTAGETLAKSSAYKTAVNLVVSAKHFFKSILYAKLTAWRFGAPQLREFSKRESESDEADQCYSKADIQTDRNRTDQSNIEMKDRTDTCREDFRNIEQQDCADNLRERDHEHQVSKAIRDRV